MRDRSQVRTIGLHEYAVQRYPACDVALVASEKRSRLIVADLLERGLETSLLQRFCAPAGLNMPTDTPLQIAFSILCEILAAQNPASDSEAML